MSAQEKIWNIVYRKSDNDIEVLILKPNPEPYRNTDYYVITGGVEPNEQLSETARRETQEEIGAAPIRVIDLNKTIIYTDSFSAETFNEHCFAVEIENTPLLLNEEHINYKWVDLSDFAQSIWWDGDKTKLYEIIEAFRKATA